MESMSQQFEENRQRPTFYNLRQDMVAIEGPDFDPKNFAKYLIWSLTRSGTDKAGIRDAIEKFNSEFPHAVLEEVTTPVTAKEGVNAGVNGPHFKFKTETEQ